MHRIGRVPSWLTLGPLLIALDAGVGSRGIGTETLQKTKSRNLLRARDQQLV